MPAAGIGVGSERSSVAQRRGGRTDVQSGEKVGNLHEQGRENGEEGRCFY